MTDNEIIQKAKEADQLLGQYKDIAKEIAEELAGRKSKAVFGESGYYSGDLGCYESGVDTICLHYLRDSGEDFVDENFHIKRAKAHEFEQKWGDKFDNARIENISILGFC